MGKTYRFNPRDNDYNFKRNKKFNDHRRKKQVTNLIVDVKKEDIDALVHSTPSKKR